MAVPQDEGLGAIDNALVDGEDLIDDLAQHGERGFDRLAAVDQSTTRPGLWAFGRKRKRDLQPDEGAARFGAGGVERQ